MLSFRTFLFIVLAPFLLSNAYAASPLNLSETDLQHARSAIYFAECQRWDEAMYHTRNTDPTIRKLIQWMAYRSKDNHASFEDITQFIDDNPDWPDMNLLHQRAEEAITLDTPKQEILNWFADDDPITGDGIKYYAFAKAATKTAGKNDRQDVTDLLRQAWIKGNFGNDEEREFLAQYGTVIRTVDHEARIDQLLWEGRVAQAKDLFHTVDDGHRRLYEARIALMSNRAKSDSILANVPRVLMSDPGLLYERLAWNERRGNEAKVEELLRLAPDAPPYPSRWWDIKNNTIRTLLRDHQYKIAYQLASHHGNEKAEDFAEAEWLAGWIALRFLNDPHSAYKHFYTLYQDTQYPISKARGAYWAGRASEKNGNMDIASKWYQIGSVYKDAFYGQLSIMKLDKRSGLNLPEPPVPTKQDIQKYKHNELVKAAAILLDSRQHDLAKKMLLRAVINAQTPGEISLITEFGHSVQHYDLSVETGKQASRKGTIVTNSCYPVLSQLPTSSLELPLSLAIIRQESGFDHNAESQVGALGLMQLMPHTASNLARELHLKFTKDQLTNPNYNLTLGTHYLQKLIRSFDGSYVLAIASYNGGQGNVRKWMHDYGDPRKSRSPDEVIDWIESIPFSETRNYTQRILENIQVYRELLHKQSNTAPVIMLDKDLKR